MQKVEGSSPFSRFTKAPVIRGFLLLDAQLWTHQAGVFQRSFRIGSGNPGAQAPF